MNRNHFGISMETTITSIPVVYPWNKSHTQTNAHIHSLVRCLGMLMLVTVVLPWNLPLRNSLTLVLTLNMDPCSEHGPTRSML